MKKNKGWRSVSLWLCTYCHKMKYCFYFTHWTGEKTGIKDIDREIYYCCQDRKCMRKFIADKNRLKGKNYKISKNFDK